MSNFVYDTWWMFYRGGGGEPIGSYLYAHWDANTPLIMFQLNSTQNCEHFDITRMVFRKHKSTTHVKVVTGLVQLYDIDWVNFEYLTLTVDPLTSIWDIMLHTIMYPEGL